MKKINIGMIGCGFAAELHIEAYKRVAGYEVKVMAVATTSMRRKEFSKKYKIESVYDSLEEMLNNDEIDVIDICTPPYNHMEAIKKIISSGKYIICEKPLTGYFTSNRINKEVYEKVLQKLDELNILLKDYKDKFFYAENLVYAPAVQKSKEILEKTKNKILFMKGEESHSGSHAAHSTQWEYTGGGSFIRQGCHPLGAILYLKKIEGLARGEEVRPFSVIGDTGNVLKTLTSQEKQYINANPVDVEDCANVILTFSDGTKANIVAGDMIVGGGRNIIEVYTNESVHLCNITPNNNMKLYSVTEEKLENVFISEKVENKSGWQELSIEESFLRGYVGEMQDFMECIGEKRKPKSDFALAYELTKIIYAAYLSAQEGRRISL